MESQVLEAIKEFARKQMTQQYGFCGVAEDEHSAILNSTAPDGREIMVTIKAEKP